MHIKKELLSLGLTFLLSASVYGADKEILLDRICALVDSEPILLSEVQDKVDHGPLVKFSDFAGSTAQADDFTRALNDSINARIIMRKVDELDIQVKDEQVENQIKQILADGNFTQQGLKDYLAKQNKTYEQYKKDIHDQMVFKRFQGRFILPLIKINDRDTETYYLKKQGSSPDSAELSIRKIVVPIENEAIASEKERLAAEIYDKLKSGLSFEEAQKIYTKGDGDFSAQTFKLQDLDSSIRSHIKDLKIGEFTPPIRVSMGFILFFVSDRRLVGSQDFMRQKDALERELHAVEVVRQTNLWLQKEREKAKITIIKE